MRKIFALVVIALAALAVSASGVSASSSSIVIPFEKHAVGPGHFTGGDPETSDHWLQHFKATLQLTVGGQSLTAALDGQFNFTTRQTVLNGVVLDGWLSGAQIHEEGQLVGFSPLTFVGTVMVMRGSAN